MTTIAETDFHSISNREFWVTQKGEKMYAHEFEDSHLINTIKLLNRKAQSFRLDKARDECEMFLKTGHRHLSSQDYYRHFRQEVDKFLEPKVTDKAWLKLNSKIYLLLLEEAEFRKLDVEVDTKLTSKHRINMKSVKSRMMQLAYGC